MSALAPSEETYDPASDQRVHPLVRAAISRRRFLAGAGFLGSALLLEATISTAGPITKIADALLKGRRVSLPVSSGYRLPTEELLSADLPVRAAQPVQETAYETHLRAKVGSMLLLGFDGTWADGTSPVVQAIRDRFLGGVVIFDAYPDGRARNVESPAQLRTLTATLQSVSPAPPLIIAVDQEGGNVARLSARRGFPGTYTAASLGAMGDPMFTQAQGASIGQTLAAAGVNLNLAPVVDMNLNRYNAAIGGQGRTFSHSADAVVRHAAAFISGMRASRVAGTLKHFPGQGSAGGDTHHGAVDVTGGWSREELWPFAELIRIGAADAVMTGHIFNRALDPSHPATLSFATIEGVLRGELGYGGVVISDDLTMGAIRANYRLEDAVVLAVEAGVDLLTIGNPKAASDMDRVVGALVAAVESGRIPEARIDASYERIRALRSRLLR